MKKSVKCAVTAALLLLLCAVGIYGIFFAPRKIGCAVDDSFCVEGVQLYAGDEQNDL